MAVVNHRGTPWNGPCGCAVYLSGMLVAHGASLRCTGLNRDTHDGYLGSNLGIQIAQTGYDLILILLCERVPQTKCALISPVSRFNRAMTASMTMYPDGVNGFNVDLSEFVWISWLSV